MRLAAVGYRLRMWRELGDTYNLLNYVSQAIRWGVNETGAGESLY